MYPQTLNFYFTTFKFKGVASIEATEAMQLPLALPRQKKETEKNSG